MIKIERCPECGRPVFYATDHVDSECEAVENLVTSNLLSALNNDMGHMLMRLSDVAIAHDLHDRASDLEKVPVEAITPHVTAWRAVIEKRLQAGETLDMEDDEDDDPFHEFKARLGLREDVEFAGPFTVRAAGGLSGLLKKIARISGAGGSEVSEDADKFQVLKDAADNLSNLLNMDTCDRLVVSQRTWTKVPEGSTTKMVTAAMDTKDQHLYVLMQSERNKMMWQLWSLCPNSGMSASIKIVGTEQRAIHRAGILIDLASETISRKTFWETATGTPLPEAFEDVRARHEAEHAPPKDRQ